MGDRIREVPLYAPAKTNIMNVRDGGGGGMKYVL